MSHPAESIVNGSEAVFNWVGEDAGGNVVRLTVNVRLKHTGCPGAQNGKGRSPQPK